MAYIATILQVPGKPEMISPGAPTTLFVDGRRCIPFRDKYGDIDRELCVFFDCDWGPDIDESGRVFSAYYDPITDTLKKPLSVWTESRLIFIQSVLFYRTDGGHKCVRFSEKRDDGTKDALILIEKGMKVHVTFTNRKNITFRIIK